jgi:hypothetical protein
MKTKSRQTKIQQEIINIISENRDCPFGFIVRELDFTYHEVLNNVLELKRSGEILKLKELQGNYTLSEAYL